MKKLVWGLTLLLSLCFMYTTNSFAETGKPWYVSDMVDDNIGAFIGHSARPNQLSIILPDMEEISCTATFDSDEIEYTLYESPAVAIYDDNDRALLLNEDRIYLCNKSDQNNGTIQAALYCGEFLSVKSNFNDTAYRGYAFGTGVLFTSSDKDSESMLYYFDWNSIKLYRLMNFTKFFPSMSGRYLVIQSSSGQDTVYFFDLQDGTVQEMTIRDQTWRMTRMTDNGAVLYGKDGVLGYLSFEDRVIYDTNMTGEVMYAGDDYYVRLDKFAVKAITQTKEETLVKKVDMTCFNDNDFSYGSVGNLFWFGAPYSDSRLYFTTGIFADGCNYQSTNGLSISTGLRYTTVNLSTSLLFSEWYIVRTGAPMESFIASRDAALDRMSYTIYEFSEVMDGYLGTVSYDIASPSKAFEKLTTKGFYHFNYDTNTCWLVHLTIEGNDNTDVFAVGEQEVLPTESSETMPSTYIISKENITGTWICEEGGITLNFKEDGTVESEWYDGTTSWWVSDNIIMVEAELKFDFFSSTIIDEYMLNEYGELIDGSLRFVKVIAPPN